MVQTVWFDAWRYQNEPAPVVALLHEMRAQLAWGSRAARSTGRNTKVAVRGALLSMEELTKKIGFQYSKFREAHREWETENLAAALPSHTLREHLHAAVAQLLPRKRDGKPAPKLVVFIDDVDRCEPEAAFRLLEGLKIYLTLDNCVFVLGMNQKAIEEAIAQRMRTGMGDRRRRENEDDDTPTMRAAAYMEKLCQNVWRLPAVRSPAQVLSGLLEDTVSNSVVRYWIRNVSRHPASFWLPTAAGRFYPDFVALLEDGRLFVVEYKGALIAHGPDTDEKRTIGELWERESGGKCLFLMAEKTVDGKDVRRQLMAKTKTW